MSRKATEVGKGDFVKVNGQWKEIAKNSAEGAPHAPRNWTVETVDGGRYGMWSIQRYAKSGDRR